MTIICVVFSKLLTSNFYYTYEKRLKFFFEFECSHFKFTPDVKYMVEFELNVVYTDVQILQYEQEIPYTVLHSMKMPFEVNYACVKMSAS